MDDLIFCLNATMPIFLIMVFGYFLRQVGLVDLDFAEKLNRFVFYAGIPILLFRDMSASDFSTSWDGKFVAFCFFATLGTIAIALLLSIPLKDPGDRGEFTQGCFRSSITFIGVALMENLYGFAGAAPLMLIGAVPLYNIGAVIILTVMRPDHGKITGAMWRKTFLDVLKNPILIGIAVGLVWSVFHLPQPVIVEKAINSFAATATPLGLLSMGATFDPKKATGKLGPALGGSAVKLLLFVAVFVPVAVALGFRGDKLVSILTMLGASATVSGFVMARNMGYEGTLSSSIVMLTTFLSAFTLTFWLFILKMLALI